MISTAPTRIITTADIGAEIDESEAIWQRDAWELSQTGWPYAGYDECVQGRPSFQRQTNWKTGLFNLPLTDRECHYNASICRRNGTLWLVTRRWLWEPYSTWNSSLWAFQLDNDLQPVNTGREIKIPNTNQIDQIEDPRVMVSDRGFTIGFCHWRKQRAYRAHQSLAEFDSNWNWLGYWNTQYGGNGSYIGSGDGDEKNWVYFRHDGLMHMVYYMAPHIVVRLNQPVQESSTESSGIKWRWGIGRGGTNPIRIGDEYWSFFHSSMAWKARKKRYYMGAYAFDAKPPFRITRITPEFLLCGSEKDPMLHKFPPVIFPCGAILENDEWLVTFGVNDQSVGFIQIPHDDLEKRMESIF